MFLSERGRAGARSLCRPGRRGRGQTRRRPAWVAGIEVWRREGEGAGKRSARMERNQGGANAREGGKKREPTRAPLRASPAEARELRFFIFATSPPLFPAIHQASFRGRTPLEAHAFFITTPPYPVCTPTLHLPSTQSLCFIFQSFTSKPGTGKIARPHLPDFGGSGCGRGCPETV